MGRRQQIEPHVEPLEHDHGWEETHPAFGMIGISHLYGSSPGLFGSDLPSNNGYIEITIMGRASRKHHHGFDSYFGRDHLIQVQLTHAQFVAMISTPNQGQGVPCTISEAALGGAYVQLPRIHRSTPRTPVAAAIETVETRAAETTEKLKSVRTEVVALLRERRVPEKTVRTIDGLLAGLETEVGKNIPFLVRSVQEATATMVTAVKIEAESALTSIATRVGFKRLREIAEAAEAAGVLDGPGPDDRPGPGSAS